jgi:parallel beta-helix repeat protein
MVLMLLLTGMVMLEFNIQSVKAEPKTWTVDDDGPADFHTIQEAINAANPGDTIFVRNGTYNENVVINKKVLLFGENKETTIIDAGGVGNVIRVGADGALINGFTLQNGDCGVFLESFSNENNITGNILRKYHGSGVYLYLSDHNKIQDNVFTSFSYSAGITLAWGSDSNLVCGNIIVNNTFGVYLSFAAYNNISDNILVSNIQSGIHLKESSGNRICRNNITNNNCGVYLDTSGSNTMEGNTIAKSQWLGIYIYGSGNNLIFHNNLINNSEQVYSSAFENQWDNGYPLGGNFWSDYTGIDMKSGFYQDQLGSDGIGDTQYTIDVLNRDRYPLMGSFNTFNAGVWTGVSYNVDIISNSTISDFSVDIAQKTISFNVSNTEGQRGFCMITIPNIIVEDLWHGNYAVFLNGEPWSFRNWTVSPITLIYINYTHSEHEITIIPEFPSTIVLPPILLTTLVAMFLVKRKTKPQFPNFFHAYKTADSGRGFLPQVLFLNEP